MKQTQILRLNGDSIAVNGVTYLGFFFYQHRLILFCYVHIFHFFFGNWGKCHSVYFFWCGNRIKSFVRAAYLVLWDNSISVEWMKAENNILHTTGIAVFFLSGSPKTADKKYFYLLQAEFKLKKLQITDLSCIDWLSK